MSGEDNPPANDDQPQSGGQAQGQPSGQPQAQPAGQAAPAQGQQPVRQGPSLLDQLQTPESMYWLKFNVALFAVAGAGYAIAFLLFESLLPGSGLTGASTTGGTGIDQFLNQLVRSIITMIGLIGGFSIGVLLASVNGTRIGREYQAEQNLVLANSFVGSAVGFLAMAIIVAILLASSSLGDLIGPLVGFAVGVGATGALSTYVTRQF